MCYRDVIYCYGYVNVWLSRPRTLYMRERVRPHGRAREMKSLVCVKSVILGGRLTYLLFLPFYTHTSYYIIYKKNSVKMPPPFFANADSWFLYYPVANFVVFSEIARYVTLKNILSVFLFCYFALTS